MVTRSRRYTEARDKVDRSRRYTLDEAVELIKSVPHVDFDETVELAVQLGIDPKQTDQQIRTSIALPHGTGKSVSVVVFAEGDDADKAIEAGADEAGSDELVERVEDGWMDFDVALATPSMMSQVGRLGRYLGPRGLMPTPKNGTVRSDIADAVEEFKAGKVEMRNDDSGNIHVPVGKISFDNGDIEENIQTVLRELVQEKPTGVSGQYFKNVVVTCTMGPGVKLAM